jgi:hypothetical protein
MRKPLGQSPIDPRRIMVFFDSCAFDPKYAPEDSASNKLLVLIEKHGGHVLIAHSNQKELEHPNTPSWVKKIGLNRVSSCRVSLTPDEIDVKDQILKLLVGFGKRVNMEADATHIFEAQKYGATFFVTVDEHLLKRHREIKKLCGVNILKPSKVLEIYKNSGVI